MRPVYVAGVGMTPFGKFPHRTLGELGAEAFWAAVRHAGISARDVQHCTFSNCLAGLLTGQEAVRGQTVLRHIGIQGIPVINVENACASGSTAFFQAWLMVASEQCEVALALGAEKMYVGDTPRTLSALATCTDVSLEGAMGFLFPGHGAVRLREHMERYGTTLEQVARVTVKNHANGQLNPYAQHRRSVTVEEVLASRIVTDPIRLLMTAPISDGAGAVILCSESMARKIGGPLVRVRATTLQSGNPDDAREEGAGLLARTAQRAYEIAGLGPGSIDVAEVHDAMAAEEIREYEELGFCKPGEGGQLVDEGYTKITGKLPVNPSGGLTSRGHPVGATGLAQIAELVWQLRAEASGRQVEGARIGLAENGGGEVGGTQAAMAVHILERVTA